MTDHGCFHLSREEVIRQEIETAIDLFWSGGSLVTANLIAWAAIDLCNDIASHRGDKTLSQIINDTKDTVQKRSWFGQLKKGYNQSKHGDKDPTDHVFLSTEVVRLAIFQAAEDYRMCFDKLHTPMMFFQSWMYASDPAIVKPERADLVTGAITLFGKEPGMDRARGVWAAYKSNRIEFDRLMQQRLNRLSDGSRAS
ncbi:hypothetical protein [Sphingomonas sp. M1-B02]|uniref:hypothetical protein n=1 Tax=Sphingomonas sp. M1-B02 TaxID=3114300 RepID=UPI00224018A9|nr:hypothetical protein [Sphingomonas sp. S6-11]UZK65643.1 hypothetical protein OKW87_14160 [Sphingomonas sp. S6-11]